MMPRRLPLHPHAVRSSCTSPWKAPAPAVAARWPRKAMAIALHTTCLGLFGILVVWPVVSPIASGELAREFRPLLEALAGSR